LTAWVEDLLYLALTVICFLSLWLLVRGAERL
jgi:hypothetical protein